jgi:hypothetical protein
MSTQPSAPAQHCGISGTARLLLNSLEGSSGPQGGTASDELSRLKFLEGFIGSSKESSLGLIMPIITGTSAPPQYFLSAFFLPYQYLRVALAVALLTGTS